MMIEPYFKGLDGLNRNILFVTWGQQTIEPNSIKYPLTLRYRLRRALGNYWWGVRERAQESCDEIAVLLIKMADRLYDLGGRLGPQ